MRGVSNKHCLLTFFIYISIYEKTTSADNVKRCIFFIAGKGLNKNLHFLQSQPSSSSEAVLELKKTLISLVESMEKGRSTELWELVLATCDGEPKFCLSVPMVAAAMDSNREPFLIELSYLAYR